MTQPDDAFTISQLDYGLHYRKWHTSSASHSSAQIARLDRLFGDLLPPACDSPVIDIGCGMGFAMQMLRERGFTRVVGIDIDAGQIKECQQQDLNTELVCNTADYLSDKQNTFSLALMIDVLEHLPWSEQLLTLRAVADALQENGRLIVAVPNATSPIAMRWRHIDYTHFNSFTEYSIDFLLRNAGFTRVQITSSDPATPLRSALSPLRFFSLMSSRQGRRSLKLSLVRWVWKQILDAELPCDVSKIPLGRNLHVVAFKN